MSFFGFLDDDPKKQTYGYNDLPVLGGLCSWKELSHKCLFLTSLYSPKKNCSFFELVRSLGIPKSRWATVIDPCAAVSATATMGHGAYIGPGAVLEPMVCLGNLCAMLGNAYVAHHSRLADHVVCANSVSIAGGVSIGEASFIGANATVREYVRVGSRAVVGMGSVVLMDVADGQTVVGNPARPMRKYPVETDSPDGAVGKAR